MEIVYTTAPVDTQEGKVRRVELLKHILVGMMGHASKSLFISQAEAEDWSQFPGAVLISC